MTRRNLRNRIKIIVLLCLFLAGLGGLLYYIDNNLFQVFKDLILLLVAIPAAFLADYFQKRSQFEDALRVLWTNILDSVNDARQYTHRTSATEQEFGEIVIELRKSIDEVRSVYKNINESKSVTGFYPFESLKLIYRTVSELGHGTLDPRKANLARIKIDHYWGNFKESFLWEFDRPEPDLFSTPHFDKKSDRNNFSWAVIYKEQLDINGAKYIVSLEDKFQEYRIMVADSLRHYDLAKEKEVDQKLLEGIHQLLTRWDLDRETDQKLRKIISPV